MIVGPEIHLERAWAATLATVPELRQGRSGYQWNGFVDSLAWLGLAWLAGLATR